MPLVLAKRLVLGVPIKPSIEDNNMTLIENAINGFASQLSASLNPDGTLKNNTVSTASLQDRAVTLSKLAYNSNFYEVDTGAANALAISFTPTLGVPYSGGMLFFVKVVANNTGASTLAVATQGPAVIKKISATGLIDLVAGDLIATGVYAFMHDGTQFVLLNPTPASQFSTLFPVTPQVVKNWVAAATWATIDISAWVPTKTKYAQLYCNGQAIEAGAAPVACQFQTSFRSDALGLVYQGLLLYGGNIAGTPVSFPATGQFLVPVKVAGAVVSFDAQLVQTVIGNGDSVSETLTLIGYST